MLPVLGCSTAANMGASLAKDAAFAKMLSEGPPKAVPRQNAIKWGHRIEQPEIVTDPDVALGQPTMAVWLFEESPSEHRAAVAYTWCQRLVDLGAGDVLNGFPASIVAGMGAS